MKEYHDLKMLKLGEVIEITGVSRSEIYRRMKINEFPQAYNVGTKSVAWRWGEIKEFLLNMQKNDLSAS